MAARGGGAVAVEAPGVAVLSLLQGFDAAEEGERWTFCFRLKKKKKKELARLVAACYELPVETDISAEHA